MGVNIKMVTCDNNAIAKEISSQVNLKSNIANASDFVNESDSKAKQVVENADRFAQVFPEHKYRM